MKKPQAARQMEAMRRSLRQIASDAVDLLEVMEPRVRDHAQPSLQELQARVDRLRREVGRLCRCTYFRSQAPKLQEAVPEAQPPLVEQVLAILDRRRRA
jgi:hypothetical protein